LTKLRSNLIASGINKDSSIKIWDLSTGVCKKTLNGPIQGVSIISKLDRNQIVTGSWKDYSIKIWNLDI